MGRPYSTPYSNCYNLAYMYVNGYAKQRERGCLRLWQRGCLVVDGLKFVGKDALSSRTHVQLTLMRTQSFPPHLTHSLPHNATNAHAILFRHWHQQHLDRQRVAAIAIDRLSDDDSWISSLIWPHAFAICRWSALQPSSASSQHERFSCMHLACVNCGQERCNTPCVGPTST